MCDAADTPLRETSFALNVSFYGVCGHWCGAAHTRPPQANSGIEVAIGMCSMSLESFTVPVGAPPKRRRTDNPAFAAMPAIARAYVVVVVAAGAACLAGVAMRLHVDNVPLLLMLLAIAVVTSAGKIELPLGRSQSNLSLSHAVNFWALFAVGPTAAIGIAAVSAWAQCTLRSRGRNPLYRTVFSVA